ncbi:MAG: cyclic lactone autoinducer peptide [Lachnospiraceae bacterium]|nr:cyclic lactone autoinducer peptide [Lachnospiraceae bacterium]
MISNILLNLLAKLALIMAKFGAGAASIGNNYQPDLPSQLKQ